MAIALLLNRVSRWARLVLTAVLLFVWAVPSTVSTQVFYWLFSNQYGAANYLLGGLPGVHLQGHDWFADPHQGLAVVSLVVIWGALPLLSLSLHAGLTQIPKELLEAARCDGASPGQVFRNVIWPFLTPLLVILATLSIIWDFGVFNQIWFMRGGHPEPGYQTIGIFMYQNGIGSSHYNSGATVGVLMMVGLLFVMVFYIRAVVPDRRRGMTVAVHPPIDEPSSAPGARDRFGPSGPPFGRRKDRRAGARRSGRARVRGCGTGVAMVLAVVLGFPIYWMLITAFKTSSDINRVTPQFWPTHPTLGGFREVLSDPIFRQDLANTFVITLAAVAISIVIGFFGALAIARFRFLGRRVFVFAVLIVQMVPLLALTIPMSLLLDRFDLKNTLTGVVIAYLMFTMPYTIWTLRTFIANIPKELDEAAMMDGCTQWQTFYKIILPLVAPGLIATGVYGWILAWNEFVLANTLLLDNNKQTSMIYLLIFQSSPVHGADYGGLMAAATLTSLPVVVLFVLFQSRISAGLTAGSVKG